MTGRLYFIFESLYDVFVARRAAFDGREKWLRRICYLVGAQAYLLLGRRRARII